MNVIKQLESGLRILIVPIENRRSVAAGIFVGAGTITECESEKGLSHFIEHMLFKGTAKRTAFQLAEEAESQGIHLNAYTSKLLTVYYALGISEHINQCVDMLSDMLFNSLFSQDCIQREQGVVLEEIAMYEDDPDDVAHEAITKAHWEGTPLSSAILGTKESVLSFDKSAIKNYMDRLYTPDNILVCIAGDISVEEGEKLIEEYFECRFEKRQAVINRLPEYQPACQLVKVVKDLEQVNVAFGFKSYPWGIKKEAVAAMIDVLCGGMSGRLFQKVREELGLVYSIYIDNSAFPNNGLLHIHFATAPSKLREAVLATRETILEFLKEGVKEKELKKIKEASKSDVVIGMETTSAVMRVMGRCGLIDNESFDIDEKLKKISQVATEDINAVAKDIFDFDNMSAAYVGPETDIDIMQLIKEGK